MAGILPSEEGINLNLFSTNMFGFNVMFTFITQRMYQKK